MTTSSKTVALIVGGSSGMGLETARELRARGQDLIVLSQNPEKLAAALGRVLSDASESSRLVAEGHRRAEAFSMLGLADQYLERYERIAVSTSRSCAR